MAQIIAFRPTDSTYLEAKEIFLERRWWRSVMSAAALQRQQSTAPQLCRFLEEPCEAVCTEDGELALEFGRPPLILLSSDVKFLPVIRSDVQRLRRLRFYYMSDRQRDRLAQLHRAGLLLIDALEELSTGLRSIRQSHLLSVSRHRAGNCFPSEMSR